MNSAILRVFSGDDRVVLRDREIGEDTPLDGRAAHGAGSSEPARRRVPRDARAHLPELRGGECSAFRNGGGRDGLVTACGARQRDSSACEPSDDDPVLGCHDYSEWDAILDQEEAPASSSPRRTGPERDLTITLGEWPTFVPSPRARSRYYENEKFVGSPTSPPKSFLRSGCHEHRE